MLTLEQKFRSHAKVVVRIYVATVIIFVISNWLLSTAFAQVVVNDRLSLLDTKTNFSSTPVQGGPAGTFTMTATLKNISADNLTGLAFQVLQLTGGNLLLNADGRPGGFGSTLTVPFTGNYSDGVLSPVENFTVDFIIGLASRNRFTFFVDASGTIIPRVSPLASSGLEKARTGDHLAAIEDYNRAIQLDPLDAYAYAFRSQSLRALGDNSGAQADIQFVLQLRLEEWNRLLTANPNDPNVYAGQAFTRLSLGDVSGAIDDYGRSLTLRPGHARTLFEVGNARYRADDKTGARDEYDQALAADPNLVEGYVARALVRLDLGDVTGATADQETARLLTPTDQRTQPPIE